MKSFGHLSTDHRFKGSGTFASKGGEARLRVVRMPGDSEQLKNERWDDLGLEAAKIFEQCA
jgi:hypothetical protein